MVNTISAQIALTMWNQSSSTTGISSDVLASWAAAKSGVSTTDTSQLGGDPNRPLAEVWQPGYTPSDAALVQRALSGKAFFDPNAKLYSDLGATGDYKNLFALHTGISTLAALAKNMETDGLSKYAAAQTQEAFTKGLNELSTFFQTQTFDDVRLNEGDRVDSEQTTLAIPATSEDYTTPVIQKGSVTTALSGLDPNAKFTITAKTLGGTVKNVAIDLSGMNSLTRSLSNIVTYVNGKLSAAGVQSRLATVDQTPKTQSFNFGGQTITQAYAGQKMYALKLDVKASETISFAAANPDPALYVVGSTSAGARLIKLSDVSDMPGQTQFLDRPNATTDPIGSDVQTGWLASGADATTYDTTTLVDDTDENTYEDKLRDAGEAVLKFAYADGRTLSISTAWKSGELEPWRVRNGETADQGLMSDLAERLTQLLHEQGVAAGVEAWNDGAESGLSVKTGDGLTLQSFTIGGSNVVMDQTTQPSGTYVGGLRDGVYARSYNSAEIGDSGTLFKGSQSFTFTADGGAKTITIAGGTAGISAQAMLDQINDKLKANNINAAASLVDTAGKLSLHFDTLHDVTAISASINQVSHTMTLAAPGAGVNGGLPAADPGEAFSNNIRMSSTSVSPLLANTGALDISVVVATPDGEQTIKLAVSAQERADHPDVAPGQWDQIFQDRLNAALNKAGVYVGALSNDLTQWAAAENTGTRIASISVNGQALALAADAPASLGGVFNAERSFTSAQAATGVADDSADLISNPNVSITIDTIWGQKTISASLQGGDPPTLQSAALRLNEALSAQGYDVGVVATDLSGNGAGLRIVTGDTHSVRTVENLSIGGSNVATTLDPVDSQTYISNPNGAARAADRADRAATATLTNPASTYLAAPSTNSSGWFPGRAFDFALEGGSVAATANAVATGADGSVYVLANLTGDSASTPIKGETDVALLKYDSAGKLIFNHILGASEDASGFALAVSSDGKVAVAGSVTGTLAGASGTASKKDSLVAVYDSNGVEQWTSRRGAKGDDEAQAVAFAPDGSVIVSGRTESALGSNIALGGSDGYVRGFSKSGLELFTKQFGTGGEDAASALLVRDNGAGGVDIITGGVENNHGVLRSFTYSANAGLSVGATRDIGNFTKGAISSLVADGSSLYVGGSVGGERVTIGQAAREAIAGQEGFVSRLNINLTSNALDRTTYLGSSGDDSVASIAFVNGQVYATGSAGGVIAGQGAAGKKSAFIARLADDGDIGWARTFNSATGVFAPSAIAVDTDGASALDVLGLPQGVVSASSSTTLISRSSLRVGDEFKIGVDDRRSTTITITAKDTMSSLLSRINTAMGGAGRAQIVKDDNGAERIKITPSDNRSVRLENGRDGHDALSGLGLKPAVIATKPTSASALRTFGLGLLASDLKLDSKDAIAKTKAELLAATSIIRQAYDAIVNPNAKEKTAEEKALDAKKAAASSSSTAIYTAQIANYQAALARLGGS